MKSLELLSPGLPWGPQELLGQIWALCEVWMEGWSLGLAVCEPGLFSTSAGQTCLVQPWTGLEWALSQDLGAAVETQDPIAPFRPLQLPSGEQAFLGGVGLPRAIPCPCSELRAQGGQGSPGTPQKIKLWQDLAVKFTGSSLLDSVDPWVFPLQHGFKEQQANGGVLFMFLF